MHRKISMEEIKLLIIQAHFAGGAFCKAGGQRQITKDKEFMKVIEAMPSPSAAANRVMEEWYTGWDIFNIYGNV
jgi:hypothetical protein